MSSYHLLGCHIHQRMKWKEHVLTNKGSLIRQLTSQVNALRKLAVNATFKTRLMADNTVFISVLSYLIPLSGGYEGYLTKALQVIQNKAARCVTKQSWLTPTSRLLSQCGCALNSLCSITLSSTSTKSCRVRNLSFSATNSADPIPTLYRILQ